MLKQQVERDYERASRKAFWNQIKSWVTRRSNELLPFDVVRRHLPTAAQQYRGAQEVRIDQIVGSEGRYRDFDRAFLPLQRTTKDRWMSIGRAHYEDVYLPPVELYKIGNSYFVKDGNHRVSVARERNQVFIDAIVTEITVPFEISAESEIEDVIREADRADFFLKTKLHELRPDNEIRLTPPGRYDKLIEHINVHRWYLGIENEREITWEEAVQSWYDRVYRPLVGYIMEEHVLADFPRRTATDLYLWIIEHRTTLRGDPDNTSNEEATADIVATKSERPLRKALRSVRQAISVEPAASDRDEDDETTEEKDDDS
ncbi:MAG: hypothetical protein KDD73_12310 [Anaerolineales bacterium]|nr:hypothetical protein [Anaerolineales bacterium]MCB9129028.1 hypothetical protein [Ardenticatenales bacterium]